MRGGVTDIAYAVKKRIFGDLIHLPLGDEVLLHNLILLVYVVGWHVGVGEVFASSLVVGSDPHFMNLFQDLSAVLNAKLVKKLFYVLRSFTLS